MFKLRVCISAEVKVLKKELFFLEIRLYQKLR